MNKKSKLESKKAIDRVEKIMKPVESLQGLPLRLAGFSSLTFKSTFGDVHYFEKRTNGSAKSGKSAKSAKSKGTLVFLHGIGANASHFGRVLVQLQKEGYCVLALDLPSHGLSPNPKVPMSPDVLFKIFVEWVDHVSPEKFILVGNSLGGGLALRYYSEHPERLVGLLPASPAGGFKTKKEWEVFRKELQFKSLVDADKFLRKIHHKTPFFFPLLSPLFYGSLARKGVAELLDLGAIEDFNLSFRGKGVQPPALLIWGQSERIFPRRHLAELKKKLPKHFVYEEPKGIAHCPQLDNPKWFSSRVDAFARSIASARSAK